MITTNGIHIAVARLACSFLFLKNATPSRTRGITHWRQATLSAASNEASGALSANTNLSRRRIATNSEIWFIISFISSPTQCTNRVLRTGVNSGPACEAERKGALSLETEARSRKGRCKYQYKRCQDGIARFKAGDMMPHLQNHTRQIAAHRGR